MSLHVIRADPEEPLFFFSYNVYSLLVWKLPALGSWNDTHTAREGGDVAPNHSGQLSCQCHHSFTALSPHKPSNVIFKNPLSLTFVSYTSSPFKKNHWPRIVLPIYIPESDIFNIMHRGECVPERDVFACYQQLISCR